MRRIGGLLAMVVLVGCGSEPTGPASTDSGRTGTVTLATNASGALRDLAALRGATARFHRFEVAEAAGWNVQFPSGCSESAIGGQGLHYLNGAAPLLDPTQPQLLMYEPQADGTLRLVGAEFVGPGGVNDPAPVMFGEAFHWNATFQLWVLHVWVFRDNPLGLHADWNPRVSCAHEGAALAAAD